MNAFVAIPLANTPVFPSGAAEDAELIEIGRQFDIAIADLGRTRARMEDIGDRSEAAIIARTGRTLRSRPIDDAYISARIQIEDEFGFDEAITAHNAVYDRIDALTEIICGMRAASIAGLAVRARATAISCSSYWRCPFADLNWDVKQTVLLLEAIFAAAGLPTVREYLGINIDAIKNARPVSVLNARVAA